MTQIFFLETLRLVSLSLVSFHFLQDDRYCNGMVLYIQYEKVNSTIYIHVNIFVQKLWI